LSVEISGLWAAVKKVYYNERYFNALIQWDDAWLISVLKRGFFAKYYNSEDTVKFKLEEFLSNKKYYNSVIKRMDDFYILDKEVAEELSRKNYLDILRNINQVHQDIIDAMEEIINDYNENKIPDNGFLLYKFEQLFEAIDPDSEVLNIIIKSTVDKVVSSYGDKIIDYLVVSKKLKTGLEKMPYVYKGQKIFLLKKYSNIYIELERKRKLFPFFFIYIYNKKYIDFEEFLIKVGSELIKNILKTFNELN